MINKIVFKIFILHKWNKIMLKNIYNIVVIFSLNTLQTLEISFYMLLYD